MKYIATPAFSTIITQFFQKITQTLPYPKLQHELKKQGIEGLGYSTMMNNTAKITKVMIAEDESKVTSFTINHEHLEWIPNPNVQRSATNRIKVEGYGL